MQEKRVGEVQRRERGKATERQSNTGIARGGGWKGTSKHASKGKVQSKERIVRERQEAHEGGGMRDKEAESNRH